MKGDYFVRWQCVITGAESPEHAVLEALRMVRDPNSPGTVFKVAPVSRDGRTFGEVVEIDSDRARFRSCGPACDDAPPIDPKRKATDADVPTCGAGRPWSEHARR